MISKKVSSQGLTVICGEMLRFPSYSALLYLRLAPSQAHRVTLDIA